MDVTSAVAEINALGIEERIRIVELIWEGIAAEGAPSELTDAQRREVERRLAAHERSPDTVVRWEEVKADALDRARR